MIIIDYLTDSKTYRCLLYIWLLETFSSKSILVCSLAIYNDQLPAMRNIVSESCHCKDYRMFGQFSLTQLLLEDKGSAKAELTARRKSDVYRSAMNMEMTSPIFHTIERLRFHVSVPLT
jgi:hypothetical protein